MNRENKILLGLSLFAIVLFAFCVWADVDTKDGTAFTSTSDVDGFTSSIDDYDGQVVSPPCPPWYADTNVKFSWDGEHDDGYWGCESDGTLRDGNTQSATITTFDGQKVIEYDDAVVAAEIIQWNQDYLEESGSNTICIKAYVTDDYNSTSLYLFYAGDGSNDQMYVRTHNSENRMIGYWDTEGDDDNAQASTAVYDTWSTWMFSVDCVTTNDTSARIDANAWEDDNDAITDMTTAASHILIGNKGGAATDAGQYIYISQFAFLSAADATAYKVDCTSLTGW